MTSGKIYLLSGDSGAGKTTILEAIYWCLYGKATAKSLIPWKANPKTMTSVIMNLTTSTLDLTIERTSNALTLKVKNNLTGLTLESVPAQEYIDEIFGCCDFWLSTSYLKQKGFNPFIRGSSGEKRKLLDRVTFANEHPDLIIDKLDKLITETGNRKEFLRKQFDVDLEKYKKAILDTNTKVKDIEAGIPAAIEGIPLSLVKAKYQDISLEIDHITKMVEVGLPLVNEMNRLKLLIGSSKMEELELRENNLRRQLAQLETKTKRDTLQIELFRLKTTLEREELVLSELPDHQIPSKYYSDSEIHSARQNELNYIEMKRITDTLGIEYDQSIISRVIDEHQSAITKIEKYTQSIRQREILEKELLLIDKEINDAKSELRNVDYSILSTSPKTLEDLNRDLNTANIYEQDRYNYLIQSLQTPALECPHCKNCVKISGNLLLPVDKYDPSQYRAELSSIQLKRQQLSQALRVQVTMVTQTLNAEISNYQHNRKLEDLIQYLQRKKDSIKLEDIPSPLDTSNLDKLKSDLYIIRKWKYIPPPVILSDTMLKARQQLHRENTIKSIQELKSKINKINVELEAFPIPDNISDLTPELIWRQIYTLDEVKKGILRFTELKANSAVISHSEYVEKLAKLTALKTTIANRGREINLLKVLIGQRDALVKVQNELTQIVTREANLSKLKEAMITIQHARYALATSQINMRLMEIVRGLYTIPISIQLRMFRMVKKGNRIKPDINLFVLLDNTEIDINYISGGETDRLSIALTLALSKVTYSPLLLLDEIFSSLPANDRDRTIDMIVKHGKSTDKFFLCIAPNSSSNWFEQEIVVKPQ